MSDIAAPAIGAVDPHWPTDAQCVAALRAAGIAEPLRRRDRLGGGYSFNQISALNGRYLLRAARDPGAAARYGRERAALEALHDLPALPRVLAGGDLPGDTADGAFLLLTLLPGEPLFRHWLSADAIARDRLIVSVANLVRPLHAVPERGYRVGHYQTALLDWSGSWQEGHDEYLRQLLAAARNLPPPAELASLIDEAARYYNEHRAALRHAVGPRRAHHDLQPYNILANGDRATGLIDWEWAFGGGGEPDCDLAALVRWAIYPADIAEEALEGHVTEADFAPLIPALLAAYPEIAAIPDLHARLTIYQLEHELHTLVQHARVWPGRNPPRAPQRRLHGWLREHRLAPYFPDSRA